MDGYETAMLFVSDEYASITPSIKRLRAFKKVFLKVGESKDVSIKLAISDLAFVGLDNKFIVESGKFILNIGNLNDSIIVK